MTLILPICSSISNLVEIDQESAEIHSFVYFPGWRPPPTIFQKVTFWTPDDTYIDYISLYLLTISISISISILTISILTTCAHRIWCKSTKNWLRYTLLCIFQDGVRRHLGFVTRRFWTTHDVPVPGFYVTCRWRNDKLEFIRDIMILPFHDFGWKMLILANFEGVLGDLTP